MTKRSRDSDDDGSSTERAGKRNKVSNPDRLSKLSDELILRILSCLTVPQLTLCQRLSHKYQRLAGDDQLWKALYYNRFVRPRASRLPGLKEIGASGQHLRFASKTSAWLDDEYLVRRGARTNWRKQYKLRHNWSKGSCAVNEILVAQQAPVPPILVQMQDSVIYTADPRDGLRAWSTKSDRGLIASVDLSHESEKSSHRSPPTSLAVDAQEDEGYSVVVIGFEDGTFRVFSLDYSQSEFSLRHAYELASHGVLTAVAVHWPFVLTMTATQSLTLYRFSEETLQTWKGSCEAPQLLHSLNSHTVWPPLKASLRVSSSSVLVCVAYALPTYLSGWTVGIQEVKVSKTGELQSSRTASAIDQHYRPLAFSVHPIIHHLTLPINTSRGASTTAELRHIHAKPTSLSYTHPYLLVSHPDNTLALYLVTSTAETLTISPGTRLWGHTSSVSGAHVGCRGKAVSVSRRGDELRIWELEGGFVSSSARKRLASNDLSVQIRPDNYNPHVNGTQPAQSGLDIVQGIDSVSPEDASDDPSELTLTRGWIGFDEENVVFLKEESQGKQALVVYDFT